MTALTAPEKAGVSRALRNLYLIRFGFQVGWAIAVALTASALTPLVVALLVLYPVFDLVCAVIDFRSAGATRPKAALYLNMALSALAAIALALFAATGSAAVLSIWGLWAVTAGAVQLAVALRRYRLGGQWPMILSGGISVFAGTGFFLQAGGPQASLVGVAGYATLGAVFFLASAIRLHSAAKKA
ncbi:hypothetical protein [Marinitenerispora sediminis]|uniref:DUF308 domain-containing protein n=1 Tax=Marinitenerispora sediminis TaxID=1931232 RepID=A0A368T492_9ACTN|nr:hypothetical protein [Marinitenerispora sediminis]RCV50302.1 hypothetical protein DEF28_18455 [Marinitenerispora sediminis]RCV53763.1 hypothetical protein DEF23_17045 [Marinitenerispora sediminis]RCV58052.1 hypothetical protein DEF24_14215 [Marinitenerispora sediminis]